MHIIAYDYTSELINLPLIQQECDKTASQVTCEHIFSSWYSFAINLVRRVLRFADIILLGQIQSEHRRAFTCGGVSDTQRPI